MAAVKTVFITTAATCLSLRAENAFKIKWLLNWCMRTAAGIHSSVAERSHSEQSTCYGPSWHSSGYHPPDGVAWSQPGDPRGNAIVPCWANISETRCDGSSQVWSQLMMREQLLEPLVEQSTCYGLFWFLWRICECHSLEGVAWSRPISTRRNVLVFCRVPLTCSSGIHLERLPLGSLWVLRR